MIMKAAKKPIDLCMLVQIEYGVQAFACGFAKLYKFISESNLYIYPA